MLEHAANNTEVMVLIPISGFHFRGDDRSESIPAQNILWFQRNYLR